MQASAKIKEMDEIRHNILSCLQNHIDSPALLIEQIEKLTARHGSTVYPVLIHILTGLQLSADEAIQHWDAIRRHHAFMRERLQRDVSLQTVLCDYFCTVTGVLRNVKLIDISEYEQTVSQSRIDHITGLYNRRVFNELFEREVSMAQRHGTDLSLLFFDIDDFKDVNDRYGHLAGDEVLRQVSRIFQATRRNEDIVARFGGEEIVVLLPHTGKQPALILGERIRRRIERLEIIYDNHRIRVTVSGGLASFPFDCAGADSLQRDADQAMYQAKYSGKNQISLFSDSKRRYARARLETSILVRDLHARPAKPEAVLCRNISGGGLLLESERAYPVGTILETRMALRPENPFLLAGRVVYCRRQPAGGFETGISLIEVDLRAALEISCYIFGKSTGQADGHLVAATS